MRLPQLGIRTVAVTMLLVTGCAAPPAATSAPAPVAAAAGAALRPVGAGHAHTVRLRVGQHRYDALTVVANTTEAPVTLMSVSTAPAGDASAVEMRPLGVVPLPRSHAGGLGIVDNLPPALGQQLRRFDPGQVQLAPERPTRTRYALLFLLAPRRPGHWTAPTVTVTYRSGDQERSLDLPHPLTVCVSPESTTDC